MTDHISSRESSPAASVKVFGELLARLEAATEWNRELDREVAWAVLEQDWSSDDWERAERRPQFTASLDAAIGLVERVLPDACWRIERMSPALAAVYGGPPDARDWASCGISGEQEGAWGKTPALALLTALLRALLANTSPSQAIGEG